MSLTHKPLAGSPNLPLGTKEKPANLRVFMLFFETSMLFTVYFLPYGVKTSTEENRKGYPGFSTIYEQKSKLTMLEIGSVILKRSI